MKRILWVNGCPFVGGSETAQLAMFRELRSRYHIVAAIPERPGRDLTEALTELDIRYHEVPFRRLERTLSPMQLLNGGRTFTGVTRQLSGLVKSERIDIVHTANLYDLPFCSAVARMHGRALLWLIENPERFDRFNTTFVNLCRTNAVVGTSHQILSDGLAAGLRVPITAVIGNPYDDALFYAADGYSRPADKPVTIGFAGVFSDRKGTLELCRAYATLSSRLKREGLGPSELHLAGSGAPEYTDRVTDLLTNQGLMGETRLLGNVSRSEMRQFYQSLDVYIMLSKREGLSVAMLEAMASGAPSAILSPWGDDVIKDGVTGIRLRSDHPEQVVDAIWPLVRDAALRREVGAAGAAHVKANFAPAAVAGKLQAVYDELIESPRGAART